MLVQSESDPKSEYENEAKVYLCPLLRPYVPDSKLYTRWRICLFVHTVLKTQNDEMHEANKHIRREY
jgi:hypothetical protein